MRVKRLMEIANEMDVEAKTHKLTDGRIGIIIPLERVVYGTAHMIPNAETIPLMKYLKRVKAEWKYVGYYTGIMVMLPAESNEGGAET